MRYCDGCSELNKRLKHPCKKGFRAYKSDKTGKVVRPNNCKSKPKLKIEKEKDFKKKAVDAFQMYIRYRDNWTCVVCGKHIAPDSEGAKQLMHAGHYVSRGKTALLLDEKNCHAQCRECNGKQNWEGIDPRYTKYLISKYGIEILDYLNEKKHKTLKLSKAGWKELAEFWQGKLAEIKQVGQKTLEK